MFPRIYQPIRSREAVDARIHWGETVEDINLDFKAVVTLDKPEELAMDVAAFANTFGGTLLIGVSEKSNERKLKVAQGRVTVENAELLRRFFNQDIRSYVHPGISLTTDFIHYDDVTTLCAVNVEPSVDLVWVIVNRDTSAAAFPYRNDYGKNYWRPHEAEMRWNAADRKVYLKFVELVQGGGTFYVTLYPDFVPPAENDPVGQGRFFGGKAVPYGNPTITMLAGSLQDRGFTISWGGNTLLIPYGFVKEVWQRSSNYLSIFISARVYYNGQRLDLVPLEK